MTAPVDGRSSRPSRVAIPAVVLGTLVLVLYLFTLAPSLVWGDGGRLQTDAITGGSLYWFFDELASVSTDGWVFDRLGAAAWDHPLWVMAGHGVTRFPVDDPSYLLNLLSAVPAAGTVVVVHLLIARLTQSQWAAAIGAASLAVAHTFWFHAVTAEVYALHSLFMVASVWATIALTRGPRPRLLLIVALLAGLGLANHSMLVLTIAPLVVFVLASARRDAKLRALCSSRWLGLALLVFAVGLAPWWIQFLRMVGVAGFRTAATMAAGFPWLGDRWPGALLAVPGNLVEYLGVLSYQFTPLGVATGVYGIARLRCRGTGHAALLTWLFALHVAFSANYAVADRFAFHLPSYVVFALFVGVGLDGLLRRAQRQSQRRVRIAAGILLLVALPVAVYSSVPRLAGRSGVTDTDVGIPPIGVDQRDGVAYYLAPSKRGDAGAARFGRGALASLPTEALVLTAWPDDLEAYVAMRHYQLTEGLRPDVTLELMIFTGLPLHESVIAITTSQANCRPLFLASLDRDAYPIDTLEDDFDVVADTHLYRLEPRRDTRGDCAVHAPTDASLDDLIESVRR